MFKSCHGPFSCLDLYIHHLCQQKPNPSRETVPASVADGSGSTGFLGLPDPDPLVRAMDPDPDPAVDPDPDPSIIMQK
jgi:hypothetical protein